MAHSSGFSWRVAVASIAVNSSTTRWLLIMKRNQSTSNFGLVLLAGASLSLACTSTEPDPMGSDSASSTSTQTTEDSGTSMGDSETSMEAGDGDSAGDGDGDMGLDCSTVVASGNMVNTVPEDFSLLGSDGTLHSLHSFCNEVVYAVAGTMW